MADWFDKGLLWKDFLSDSGIILSSTRQKNGEFAIYDCCILRIYNTRVDEDFLLILSRTLLEHTATATHRNVHILGKAGALGITTQCDDVPLACKFWDYGYSEGAIRGNYGLKA